MIGSSIANVESAMIQVVGTRAEDDSCLACLQGRGIWNSCVYVEWEGVKICANCHWCGNDSRCHWPTLEELNPDPVIFGINDYDYDSDDGFNDEDGHDGDDDFNEDDDGYGEENNLGLPTGGDNSFSNVNATTPVNDAFQYSIQALNNARSAIQPST